MFTYFKRLQILKRSIHVLLLHLILIGPKWVIGEDYRKGAFVISWNAQPLTTPKTTNKRFPLPIFSKLFPRNHRAVPVVRVKNGLAAGIDECPLNVLEPQNPLRSPYVVWDGHKFVDDLSFNVECSIDRADVIDGCCETGTFLHSSLLAIFTRNIFFFIYWHF